MCKFGLLIYYSIYVALALGLSGLGPNGLVLANIGSMTCRIAFNGRFIVLMEIVDRKDTSFPSELRSTAPSL